MTFSHLNRRIHLYLGLSLLPWFFMYGLSSLPFAHGQWVEKTFYDNGVPMWTLRLEKPYSIDIPEGADLRPIGARIIADAGVEEGSFGTYLEKDGRVNVYRHDFWRSTRLTYFPATKTLKVEDRRFRWDHFLTGMHARGGFEDPRPLNQAWGVIVDIVCFGMLLWIASGLYMWWHIKGHRGWGWLALIGGVASYAGLMFFL